MVEYCLKLYETEPQITYIMAHKINLETDIIPLSDFRKNTASIMKQLKKDRRPIVLTQNGKSAAVLIDVAEYQGITEFAELTSAIEDAEFQLASGAGVSQVDAEQVLLKNLAKWK